MKTKQFFTIILLVVVMLFTACAPAARRSDVAVEEPASESAPIAESRVGQEFFEEPAEEEAAAEEKFYSDGSGETNQPSRIDNTAPSPMPTQAPLTVTESEEGYYEDDGEYYEAPLPSWTNEFQDYGVNPFEHTERDHLSTFALDVDTGSYTVMRRYINEGSLPPYDAVRVEEFVNYFDPGYAAPSGKGFALYADGAENPFSPDDTYLLRFGVQGYEVDKRDRKPANLTFVIDVSGSMDMENRLGLVKQSLEYLVDQLNREDNVAIIIFGSRASVHLRPTSGNNNRSILSAIRQLRSGGSTNAEQGLTLGYRTAMSMYDENAINRVILCSDGVANVGMTGPDGILNKVQRYVDQGIYLTTVGFGMGNFNDVLMEQLADNGDGFYAYVDDLDGAKKLFVDEITSTLQVIARDAKVQVDFNTDTVEAYRLVGYENRDVADEDFRNDEVDAGEIGAGHHVVAIYEVVLYPDAQGRISTVSLRWEDPDSGEVTETNGNFNTWDMANRFEDTSDHYKLAVYAMQYAEILRESPWAWDVSIRDIRVELDQLARSLHQDKDVVEFADLVYYAEELMDYRW